MNKNIFYALTLFVFLYSNIGNAGDYCTFEYNRAEHEFCSIDCAHLDNDFEYAGCKSEQKLSCCLANITNTPRVYGIKKVNIAYDLNIEKIFDAVAEGCSALCFSENDLEICLHSTEQSHDDVCYFDSESYYSFKNRYFEQSISLNVCLNIDYTNGSSRKYCYKERISAQRSADANPSLAWIKK